ncbi:hypothetical protein [Pseudovibrio sp. Tun.PSC04-5.I4]|uniref:hypothetical protein n=1 Tax=Pseudovibrio sp. Tun.PSC04-5.I4 TaxID=1798213 RepID=UPI000888468C|nr:hypothetical protein [Pseudovibrio sp. Tun.PSC04-5.I4]SDR47629.1 hypothetical protein SAMN04515695_5828 [Pseudovibrio sp. Tun.PSC04-5.I4]
MSIHSGNGAAYSLSNYSVAKYVGNAGFSSGVQSKHNLTDPDGTSKKESEGSTLKPISGTAIDARAELTSRYGDLDTSSSKYHDDIEGFRNDIFDDLNFDRQTLHAISSNETGYFSKEEIKAAKLVMEEQLDSVLKGDNPDAVPIAENYLNLLQFLDEKSSAEEKKSFVWAEHKAEAQANYKRLSGGKASEFNSDDPVVTLLTQAYEELFEEQKNNPKAELESTSQYNSALYQWERNNNSYEEYKSPFPW